MANNRGGVFKTVDGKCEGPWQVDSHPMVMKGEVIWTIECGLVTDSLLYAKCKEYGSVLRSIYAHNGWHDQSPTRKSANLPTIATSMAGTIKVQQGNQQIYQQSLLQKDAKLRRECIL
jgi:hypothetical protein